MSFKIFLFGVFKPLEKIFGYNRKRRDKWVIKQADNIPNGSRVLDVGAGGCPHRKLFSHCEYFSQDFAQLSDNQIQHSNRYSASIHCKYPVIPNAYCMVLSYFLLVCNI